MRITRPIRHQRFARIPMRKTVMLSPSTSAV
jgi:hypothetical protein